MRLKPAFCIAATCGLLLLAGAAKDDAGAGKAFHTDPFFRFGMELGAADEQVAGKGWSVIYRIDTPTTNEIAAVYQQHTYYHLGFYEGKCYLLEKRTQLPLSEVQQVFTSIGAALGETPEATQSDDGSLIFTRWTLRDREISLTADQGDGDIFKLTYEEVDRMLSGQAEITQEREVKSSTNTVVDPISGLPKIVPVEPAPGDADAPGDETAPPKDAPKDGEAEEDASDEDAPEDHDINRDDPNDW